MNRAQQREIEATKRRASMAVASGESTLTVTIYASADMMEHHALVDGEIFRDYTPKQRRRMASEGRAMPDGSFPIGTCEDAKNAIRSVGRAKPEKRAAVKSFIRRRVKALSCTGKIFDDYR